MAAQVGAGTARPTGTVTFLFSDIEGSTARWESAPDAMALALVRHDQLVRTAIEAHGGYVFKTMGDAFCAAFSDTLGAIAAALDAQRALAGEDFASIDGLRVRMALHSGRSNERDGDYFGPTVNRVARLLAIGHGGQVLLSGRCAEPLNGGLPNNCSFRDLGAHRLKDLAEPERVYQLIAEDLPHEFPMLRSLDHLSNNLPEQLSSFVGREEVIAEVKALLDHDRLVTLVGTGGAGKTRCAIQIGAELLDGSGDGVWLAELAPISDASLVAGVIARALNVQVPPNRSPVETLIGYLKRKRLLLILDNCEHVIDEVRTVVTSILRSCPELRILATSREPLNIGGERVYRMPSLAVPPPHSLTHRETIAFDAALLFADRAASMDNRFELTDENAPYIAEICRRLDGIPLALELAAARVKMLSPQQLAQMLDERFRVLTGGNRSALPRHQTMRALIDWSYDLLSVEERALFRKLSIFAGGFTLETATDVCGEGEIDKIDMLERLSSLVDKSLVQVEQTDGTARYRLLESTRQYARERLAEHGEDAEVARAHASVFLAFAEEAGRIWEHTSDRAWFSLVEPELENFRAALSWALGMRADILTGQRLAAALHYAWWSLAAAEGRRWVQTALELVTAETPPSVVAALELAEAELAASLVQYIASHAASERALTRYNELGNPLFIAYAQRCMGLALIFLGRVAEGEALLAPALEQARALGTRRLIGVTLQTLADARHSVGDIAAARAFHMEALTVLRAVGAERAAANVCVNLAEAEFHGGNASEALRWATEALDAHRGFNAARGVAFSMVNMTAYLTALERYDDAAASGRAALTYARDAQLETGLAWNLQHLAAIAALRPAEDAGRQHDDLCLAARLLGYADARLRAMESLREYTEQQEYEKVLRVLHNALGEGQVTTLMQEGSCWNEDQAVAHALLI